MAGSGSGGNSNDGCVKKSSGFIRDDLDLGPYLVGGGGAMKSESIGGAVRDSVGVGGKVDMKFRDSLIWSKKNNI